MKFKDFFVGFDFGDTWGITEGKTFPFLKANLKVVKGVVPVWYAKEYCTGKVLGTGMALMPEGLDERNYGGKFNVVEIGDKMVVDFSEVYALNQNGYAFVSDTLDIPIQPLTKLVKGLMAPMPWSKLMVTGGVEPTQENLTSWIKAGVFCVGMGSKLFPIDKVKAEDWAYVTDKCREALAYIAEARR